jgi:altronate dehydratase large subunit
MTQAPRFKGYRRADGQIGVRNHVLVVPTVICSSLVAERIAAAIEDVGAALPHLAGCGQLGPDLHVTHDTLAAYCRHPNVGAVLVVDLGGSVVLGEIAEIMGAEHLLAARATNPDTSARLLRVINRVEREAAALGLDIRGTQPSPGNIRGGLTTIEEKSLGATHKAGERTPLEDVIAYAAPIVRKGLTVMDTPGLDVESVTGMVGGGAQVVVFTTGLGTPTGNPIAPVLKITGNARTASNMADNIDLDVSGVIASSETMEAAADRLFESVLRMCCGMATAAERLGHREFAIHRRNPTI